MIIKILRRILRPLIQALLTHDSYYHFLTKSIIGDSGFEFAAKAISTEYFRNSIGPTELVLKSNDRLLIIAPHQDDEAIGCGGLMLKAKKKNIDIRIIYFTDGIQKMVGLNDQQVIDVRNAEAMKVVNELNVQCDFLGISNNSLVLESEKSDKIIKIIQEYSPTKICTPWLLDFPIKHRYVNHALVFVLKKFKEELFNIEMIGYQVHNNILANRYLDITGVIGDKIELIKLYKSQNEYFKHYDKLALHMAGWNARFITNSNVINKEFEYVELYSVMRLREFITFVQEYYELDLEQTYCGSKTLINQALKFNKFRKDIADT